MTIAVGNDGELPPSPVPVPLQTSCIVYHAPLAPYTRVFSQPVASPPSVHRRRPSRRFSPDRRADGCYQSNRDSPGQVPVRHLRPSLFRPYAGKSGQAQPATEPPGTHSLISSSSSPSASARRDIAVISRPCSIAARLRARAMPRRRMRRPTELHASSEWSRCTRVRMVVNWHSLIPRPYCCSPSRQSLCC
jgi:hypothetical protein